MIMIRDYDQELSYNIDHGIVIDIDNDIDMDMKMEIEVEIIIKENFKI